jgi:hypothetical protein
MPSDFTHFLRLGTHAESETVRRARHTFDALFLNANLVEATPAACAALVYQINKPFVIDPYTYAFTVPHQYLLSRGKGKTSQTQLRPKRSFVGMGKQFFDDPQFVGRRSLTADDIYPPDLARRVVAYQKEKLRAAVSDPADAHIASSARLDPAMVIAPYFPLLDDLGWLDTNIKCLNEALVIDEGTCGLIAVGQDVLNEKLSEIVAAYHSTGVGKVFVWIDSFDEDVASRLLLDLYAKLITELRDLGIVTLNLFGGFFSCIAQGIGLGGFAHGLGYGENRRVIPVLGGGQPPPRYYAKPLHINMPVLDAASIFSGMADDRYLRDVCDCVICARLIEDGGTGYLFSAFAETDGRGRFKPRAYSLTRFHFLLARYAEINAFTPLDAARREEYLRQNELLLKQLDSEHVAAHISVWQSYVI